MKAFVLFFGITVFSLTSFNVRANQDIDLSKVTDVKALSGYLFDCQDPNLTFKFKNKANHESYDPQSKQDSKQVVSVKTLTIEGKTFQAAVFSSTEQPKHDNEYWGMYPWSERTKNIENTTTFIMKLEPEKDGTHLAWKQDELHSEVWKKDEPHKPRITPTVTKFQFVVVEKPKADVTYEDEQAPSQAPTHHSHYDLSP